MNETPETTAVAEVDVQTALKIVESLVFATDEPLSAAKMREAIPELKSHDIANLVQSLNDEYSATARTFEIQQVAGGYLMFTRPDFAEYLQRFHFKRSQNRLSSKALETLAIFLASMEPLRFSKRRDH